VTESVVEQAARSGDIERLRRLFQIFAATQCRGRSLVYETLSKAIAADDTLLRLLLAAPNDQRRPSLLLAAVNFLLARHPSSELASYYPMHRGKRSVDDQLVSKFSNFSAVHGQELDRLLRERSTQTNEIRRCVALRLGLAYVQHRWPEPVALVEVGASATLRAAIDACRSTPIARVAAGDATIDTAPIIASLPGKERVVVFTASPLTYLDAPARNTFVGQLDRAAGHRPTTWVFAEAPALLATTGVGGSALDSPLSKRNSLYLIGISLRGPRQDDALLGLADP